MKTRSKTPTAGVLMPPLDKKPGRLSHSGSGTYAWNWAMCLSRRRRARPSLLLPPKRPPRNKGLCKAMASLRSPCAFKADRFSGQDFVLQPDGVLHCPDGKTLRPTEQRREADGSLRVLYSARILDCRGCPKRPQCQWHGEATTKPRRISLLLHPLQVGPAPLLWRDWSRRAHRRACMQLLRHQRIEVSLPPPAAASPRNAEVILSRAQRAHARLSWAERFARNARVSTASQVTIRLFGVPEGFAISLGLATA